MPMQRLEDVFEFLRIAAEYDHHDSFWWRTDGEYAPVTFFVNCNDLFWWATADSEEVTPELLPLLRQTLADCKAAAPEEYGHIWGLSVFAARVRKMRPQGACYKGFPQKLWPLFDAAGEKRETDSSAFGNPTKHPLDETSPVTLGEVP